MAHQHCEMIQLNSTLLELNKGRSSVTIKRLNDAGIHTIKDILWTAPLHWNIVPEIKPFHYATKDQYFKGKGIILQLKHYRPKRAGGRRIPLYNIEAIVQDENSDTPSCSLRWFNVYPSQKDKYEQLKSIVFYGIPKKEKQSFSITSPVITTEVNSHIEIQYPTINKVSSSRLKTLFAKIPRTFWETLQDPLAPSLFNKNNLCSFKDALKTIHGIDVPKSHMKNSFYKKAKRRLIYQEFYEQQVKVEIRKDLNKKANAPVIKITKAMKKRTLSTLPFSFTDDQVNATQEILKDLQSPIPMMRMLQGDVGVGKTAVSFVAAMLANINKFQAALMCPTEILATQHFKKAEPLFKKLGLNCQLLTGSLPHKEKSKITEKIAQGEVDTVIGTHALFQDAVAFKNLALSIIDEQHRFGVDQRVKLSQKGAHPHTLIMTATPIPRSLALTQYGELDITTIKTGPTQRKGVQTRVITPPSFELFLSFLKTRISMGEQAYIIAPAIEDNNKQSDIFSVTTLLEKFKQVYPTLSLGVLHGKMQPHEKQEIFDKFSKSSIQILIATTIVEVGIDVHNATVMAIMNPENFGLTTLHQLRGRVGRGSSPGFCFLITQDKDSSNTQRLKQLENLKDGFKIAELDLELRQEGNIFGLKQSGNPQNKVSDILRDRDILFQVKEDLPLIKKSPLYAQDYTKLSKDLSIHQTI